MASPEHDVRWAESADAQDLKNPSVERASGYAFGEDYPHDQYNSHHRQLGRWVSQGFETLGDLVTVLEDGQIAPVNSNPFRLMGVFEEAVAPAGSLSSEVYDIDTDGKYLFALEGEESAPVLTLAAYSRTDLSTAIDEITVTVGGWSIPKAVAVEANGAYVAVAVNETDSFSTPGAYVLLYAWDPVSEVFSLTWTWNKAGVDVNDIAISFDAVNIAVSDDGAAGDNAFRVPFTAGSGGPFGVVEDFSFRWGGTSAPTAVDVGGGFVLWGGEDSGSEEQLRGYSDDDGGVLEFTQDLGAGVNIIKRQIATDGKRMWFVTDETVTATLYARGWRSTTGTFFQIPAPDGESRLAVDSRYIIASSGAIPYIYDRDMSGLIPIPWNAFVGTIRGVLADGDRLFVATETLANALIRIYAGHRPKLWQKTTANQQYKPWAMLAISSEE